MPKPSIPTLRYRFPGSEEWFAAPEGYDEAQTVRLAIRLHSGGRIWGQRYKALGQGHWSARVKQSGRYRTVVVEVA